MRLDRSNMAPVSARSRGGPGRQVCSEGGPGGREPRPRDLFDALEGVKLSWTVVASPQCRIGVHVHD